VSTLPDPSRYPEDAGDDAARRSDDLESPVARPRAVYVLWAVGIALVVVLLVLHLAGVFGAGAH
jgi:hypothetical protein